MPAGVKSLLNLSLQCIVLKIRYSCFPFDKPSTNSDLAKENGLELSINPFHQLPTSLLEQIILNISYLNFYYVKNSPKAKYVLKYLISPQLRFVKLYDYIEEYSTFFPQFGKLLSLTLRSTTAGDKCLEVIGTYCKSLRTLDVVNCRNITDSGVRLLCFNCDGLEMEYPIHERPSSLCKTLQHLLIYSTGVTKQGARMAIRNLTMLKFLAHERIFEILLDAELIQKELNHYLSKIHSFLFVRLLVFNISPYRGGSLGQVLQLCPSLTAIHIIYAKGLTDSELSSILSLKNLVRFQLHYHCREDDDEEDFEITFIGGVVPLLKEFGNSLRVLDIICFAIVDIWTILKFCPNLTSLFFNNHCDSLTALSESELTLFRNEKERFILKNLVKLDCAGHTISAEILHFLWSFPLLEDIYITHCDILTDEFLQNAVKCHKFNNLMRLSIRHCDFVTKHGIDSFMTHHNRIEEISIDFCQNVMPRNAYDWHLRAKRENWKLNVHFKNSETEIYYRSHDLPTNR